MRVTVGVLADLAVDQARVGTDRGALGDRRGAQDVRVRQHRDIRRERRGDVDPRRRRIEDRRALELPAAHRARVEDARGLGQLHAVVDAEGGGGIRRLDTPTASRESRSSATTSVRYRSPCAFAVPTSEMWARSGAAWKT